jgi:hypothetical protein
MTMTRYAVTGVHRIDDELLVPAHPRYYDVRSRVWKVVRDLNLTCDDEFTTGAQYGIDTIAARAVNAAWGRSLLRLCVPLGKPYNRASRILVRPSNIEQVSGGYLARNDRLLDHADVLLAFPATDREELRSGTWATIRRAIDRDVEVRIFELNRGNARPR